MSGVFFFFCDYIMSGVDGISLLIRKTKKAPMFFDGMSGPQETEMYMCKCIGLDYFGADRLNGLVRNLKD